MGQEIMEHPSDERRDDSTMEVLLEELEADLPPTKPHPAAPSPPATPGVPASSAAGTLEDDAGYEALARRLVATFEAELEHAVSAARQAALHYETARLYEYPLAEPRLALRHFTRSRALAPDHIPNLRGERRSRLATKGFQDALTLLEEEARLTPDPRHKAALHRRRAKLLADVLGQPDEALKALKVALELDPGDLTTLRALTLRAHAREDFAEVSRLLGEQARAAGQDDRLRAALLIQRAQVCEERLDDARGAAELYEAALALDDTSAIALQALQRLYETLERPRDAIRILRMRATHEPDAAGRSATHYRVAQLSAAGAEQEVLPSLDEAVAEGAAEGPLHEMRAEWLERAGRLEDAAASWAERVETLLEPRTKARCLLQLARIEADSLGDWEAATAHLEQAAALDPHSGAAAERLEAALVEQGRWADVATLLSTRAQAETDPGRRAGLELRAAAVHERRLNDQPAAIAHARAALAACSGHDAESVVVSGTAFELLARLLAETSRHQELLALHRDAVESAPSDAHAVVHLFTIGQLYEDTLGRPKEAIHVYRRILTLAPGDPRAIISLRRAAARAHAPRELVEALELEADLSSDVTQAVALTLRAGLVLLDELDSPAEAIARFRKARDLDGSCVTALQALDRAYRATGRFEELVEVRSRQVELSASPQRAADLELSVGTVLHDRLGRQDDAMAAFERARELSPTHPAALAALTQQARAKGDHTALAASLELALNACADASRRAELALELGEVREDALDDITGAREAYARAVHDAPESAVARQALARIHARLNEPPEPSAGASIAVRSETALRGARLLACQPGEEKHAAARMAEALADDPGNADLLLAQIHLLRKLGDLPALERALAALSRSLTDVEARATALRELAEVQSRPGAEVDAARATWEALWSLRPGDAAAAEALTRLALQAGDEALVVSTMERLRGALPDALEAEARVRLGELAEARGDLTSAMAHHRAALETSPGSAAAARGCYRIATKLGSPADRAWAARRQAQQLVGEPGAAELWLTSARIRADELCNLSDAEADVTRALSLDPDSEQAATCAARWLHGRPERLVEVLQQAAVTATLSERRRDLWFAVGTTQARGLRDTAAALSSLRRALAEDADHAETLASLAELEERAGRPRDAALRWAKVVELSQDTPPRIQAHLRLAALYGEALADSKRARLSLQAVLALDPRNVEGLERLAQFETIEGRPAEAALVLERLVRAVGDDSEARADAWMRLAHARLQAGDEAGSADAWVASVTAVGPHGDAMNMATSDGTDRAMIERVIGALGAWTAAQPSPIEVAHGSIAAARLLSASLQDFGRALDVLRAGLEATSDLSSLMLAYAETALAAGRSDDAIEAFTKVIAQTPAHLEAHRGLSQAYQARGDDAEAQLAAQAVALLTDGVVNDPPVVQPMPRAGSLGAELIEQLGRVEHAEAAALNLLRALGPALAKIHSPDLEAFGLVPRERMTTRSGESLRIEADTIAAAVEAGPFDLFVHRLRRRGVVLELGPTPALMVPAALLELPAARRRFEICVPLVALARGIGSVERLTPRELEVLLASAARFVEPEFGKGLTSEEVLDGERKRLYRALPRRARKPAEEAARAYVDAGQANIERLYQHSSRTAHRVAALIAGDLTMASQALVEAHPEWSALDAMGRVREADAIHDLVAFWTSPPALHLRRHAGLLGAAPQRGESP